MGDEMGTFRVMVEIENPVSSGERRTLESVLVDTGAELSWFPAAVLESLGIERIKVWHFRKPMVQCWPAGLEEYGSARPASRRSTRSCSASRET